MKNDIEQTGCGLSAFLYYRVGNRKNKPPVDILYKRFSYLVIQEGFACALG